MKTARKIIQSDHADFCNGVEKAIVCISKIENWMNKYANNVSTKFAEWIQENKWNMLNDMGRVWWAKHHGRYNELNVTTKQLFKLFKKENKIK